MTESLTRRLPGTTGTVIIDDELELLVKRAAGNGGSDTWRKRSFPEILTERTAADDNRSSLLSVESCWCILSTMMNC
jgi:hypothetical protein